jgi:hypothetical protein
MLTIKQKLDVISKLDEGSSIKQFSLSYEVYKSTVHDIRNSKKMFNYASSSDSTSGYGRREKICIQKKTW